MKNSVICIIATFVFIVSYSASDAATILVEDFEDGALDARISVQTTGTFVSAPGIKQFNSLEGQYAFGFGRSNCRANCFENFATNLVITFDQPTLVASISFIEMEVFDNWGSSGRVLADGVLVGDFFGFGRLPYNDRIADTSFRSHVFDIDRAVSQVVLRVHDITDLSEIYIDNITVGVGTPANVDPNQYDFGIIEIGCIASNFFIVENISNETFEISSVVIIGDNAEEFYIPNDNCSGTALQPAETCAFGVEFEPESLGSKAATVNISFTDMELEPLEVPLTGLVTEVCECNLNNDNDCNGIDWLLFYPDWGRTDCNDPGAEPCECDLNEDGTCNGLDWLMFYPDWGREDCPICP